MPRIARAIAVGYPHHVTQRGNYRQTVFEFDEDYAQYLAWLETYSRTFGLNIWAYCLMSNHVHLIAVPTKEDSLANTLRILHTRYSRWINQRRNISGHLWQGRFYSCALDERHLFAAIRYVENNPVRGGLADRAEKYKWSSAESHVLKKPNSILSPDCYLVKEIEDWSSFLSERGDTALIRNIIQSTRTGRPCGDETFVSTLESFLGRRFTSQPRGRPRKTKK